MDDPKTARSSLTVLDSVMEAHPTHTKVGSPMTPLEQEILRDEARFERYGGDDVEDPPPKSPTFPENHQVSPQDDPFLVTWDGPDDPENPQNWSVWRKWMVTILLCLMTINVYVH